MLYGVAYFSYIFFILYILNSIFIEKQTTVQSSSSLSSSSLSSQETFVPINLEEESKVDKSACNNIVDPENADTCLEVSIDHHTCCFVNVKLESGEKNYCAAVHSYFDFVPPFLSEYDKGDKEYVENASYVCSTTSHKNSCGMTDPNHLDDCRYHGSTTSSCCMATFRSKKTDCILSTHHKFTKQHLNYTIWENFVQCSAAYLSFNSLFTITLLLLSILF